MKTLRNPTFITVEDMQLIEEIIAEGGSVEIAGLTHEYVYTLENLMCELITAEEEAAANWKGRDACTST